MLVLGPSEQDIALEPSNVFPTRGDIRKSAALIGCIKLKTNSYAIIAHRVEQFGVLAGHKIFKVIEHAVVPFNKNGKKDKDEQQYLSLLDSQLSSATLFYSYTYDLTNSAQRNEKLGGASWKLSLIHI